MKKHFKDYTDYTRYFGDHAIGFFTKSHKNADIGSFI